MPAFIVTLPARSGYTLPEGSNSMVVFAADAANAIDVAQGHYSVPKGADAMWADATATQIVAGTALAGYELEVAITDASPLIEVKAEGNGIAIASGVVNAGGTGYATNDILTVLGGTAVRAATLRVTGQTAGVIDTVEVVDPGEYTVAPTLTANAVTGGTGTSATIDLTQADANGYEVFLGQLVTLLNADAQIAGASVDMSEGGAGTRKIIVAVGSGGDDLGDKTVQARFQKNKAPVAGLLGAVTDGGLSTANLEIAIPAVASLVIPSVAVPLKTV